MAPAGRLMALVRSLVTDPLQTLATVRGAAKVDGIAIDGVVQTQSNEQLDRENENL